MSGTPTGLSWFVNRLRVMPPAELPFRLGRSIAQRGEALRLAVAGPPGRGNALEGARPLFSQPSVLCDYVARFPLDESTLDELMDGRVSMFGRSYHLGTEPQWHRDPLTGRVAPLSYGKSIDYRDARRVGNIKTLWEPARHQHLVPLAVGYAVTGRVGYREALVRQIETWIDQNPFGRGVHWCSSLEVALRAIAWTMAHGLIGLRDGPGGLVECTSRSERFARALYQHGHFIRHHLSRYSSANNHLIGELVGLLCLGRVFDFGTASTAWAELARAELEREAERQVAPDGVAREQATHYHLEVMEYLLFAWCIGAATGSPLSPGLLDRVVRMADFLQAITPERDLPPRIGDSDEATVNRFSAEDSPDPYGELREAVEAVVEGRPARTEKAFWYRALVGATPLPRVSRIRAPSCGVRVFPEGGYAVIRSGRLLAVFDAGPLGYPAMAAHGHADALSFCLAWQGVWWLVDPGTFAYHDQARYRDYFRGSHAHNTLVIDGANQSRIGGPFMWLSRAAARLEDAEQSPTRLGCSGHHDGYASLGYRHRRAMAYEPAAGQLEVTDWASGGADGQSHDFELMFHFHPAVHLALDGRRAVARRPDCAGELVLELDPHWTWSRHIGSEEPILGWYSARLGEKEPCWTLRGHRCGRDSWQARTRIALVDEAGHPWPRGST